MSKPAVATMDGNEAVAKIAYAVSEVIAIYPITPASPMGEFSDAWAAAQKPNVWGVTPSVIEMQSEGGAAGTVHGALQTGALSTTFTASQGLLLMIPNMYKIAGELTASVFHVAARSIATHALSIFGDHSDVMATRMTGWAMLCSADVQEAHDFALISHAATLKCRIPFLHFFDGFRTSHELNKIDLLPDDVVQAMMPPELIRQHRERALSPDHPVLRGTAQNPDVFFQAREAINLYYDAVPQIVQETMDEFAALTGRQYHLFEYVGDPDAERVVVVMGSGGWIVEEAVEKLREQGEKVGVLKVRLYRPFDVQRFVDCLPSMVKSIAVLDRTKEPGGVGEPLFQDVVTALAEACSQRVSGNGHAMPRVIGGRYGLSSKEFTPAMAASIFDELAKEEPKPRFTIGITDDVTHLSLPWDPARFTEPDYVSRSVFFGLGSDGTVGANKNSVKIIGEYTDLFAQGYFVYDSKKAGAVTVSHLRFSERPIRSSYLIGQANFVACHQFQFLFSRDVLSLAQPGATFLLNSPYGPDEVWDQLPVDVQQQILEKKLHFFVVDANQLALDCGLRGRINTIMQTCFFKLSGVLSADKAIAKIKQAITDTYGKRGESIVRKNHDAVDRTVEALYEVEVPATAASSLRMGPAVPAGSPEFVERVTGIMLAGWGDNLPVSAMPVDGTFPTATSRYEKRSIAQAIPIWDADICIQCGLCAFVCPHAAIRSKAFEPSAVEHAPEGYVSATWTGKKDFDTEMLMTIQVAPDDCTGCGVCVDVCPAKSKEVAKHKAINMEPKLDHLEREQQNYEFFESIPELPRHLAKQETVKGSQLLQPLFEFSGACAGCGETPYLKLLTQLFGDRLVVANATGCSSIYGGNLPTTPWSINHEGRGPAWSNSLFEDNAEFGLGMRLSIDQQTETACTLLKRVNGALGDDLTGGLLKADQSNEEGISQQRERVVELKKRLANIDSEDARNLNTLADALVRKSVWIVGGDGWAYDIGYGGLDHVLASNHDVNILVLDTEVYSNTGGQASKSTPRAAIAKFAASGKEVRKKDLGMLAVEYGHVYVARIAMGAQPLQTLRAFHEAESYRGPSLILAFSPCIAHGIDLSLCMSHQKDAVNCGYWPIYRYDPRMAHGKEHAFRLDSRKPSVRFQDFAMKEARFAALARSNPKQAERLFQLAQSDIDDQWHFYEQMAGIEREIPAIASEGEATAHAE
ncbi:MAG: pyruvate:ferredoxin (flavodoxin) oxidoreductase [Planctomycetaceae bacterium]|nr:pyruvate:ferredoxin (flavodoxin) oxidoreductase [Planctomycetaceae bacterium]